MTERNGKTNRKTEFGPKKPDRTTHLGGKLIGTYLTYCDTPLAVGSQWDPRTSANDFEVLIRRLIADSFRCCYPVPGLWNNIIDVKLLLRCDVDFDVDTDMRVAVLGSVLS